jgi:hypothetical protein
MYVMFSFLTRRATNYHDTSNALIRPESLPHTRVRNEHVRTYLPDLVERPASGQCPAERERDHNDKRGWRTRRPNRPANLAQRQPETLGLQSLDPTAIVELSSALARLPASAAAPPPPPPTR